MPRYVAFLRGINLGKRRVKMDRLREAFESFGCDDVATYIASGNVIFESASEQTGTLEAELESHLLGEFGFQVDTFIRSLAELAAIDLLSVFPSVNDDPEYRVHVMFLKGPPGEEAERNLRELTTADDSFHVIGREAYWLRRGRMSDSVISMKDLANAIGNQPNTMRNMNTVQKIVAKF